MMLDHTKGEVTKKTARGNLEAKHVKNVSWGIFILMESFSTPCSKGQAVAGALYLASTVYCCLLLLAKCFFEKKVTSSLETEYQTSIPNEIRNRSIANSTLLILLLIF